MTLGKDGFSDGGPAAAVTKHCVMDEEGYWFLLFGNLKFFLTVCSAGSVE